MPVTVRPSQETTGVNHDGTVNSSDDLRQRVVLNESCWGQRTSASVYDQRQILQSSFHDLDEGVVIPYGGGLVEGVIRAFQQDLHLTFRPDDIWLAIMVQFSYFVNGNAEAVREHFVAHQGKADIELDIRPYYVSQRNAGELATLLVGLVQQKLVDPDAKDWIIPDFTTTTENDQAVASIVMLGAFKEYFSYAIRGGCGFPSVTLDGDKSDWEKILQRLDKLSNYGAETARWS